MLITLAIIGVVSAIVIPTVVKNYNDRKYNTARLKALKTFGDAGKLASINDEMNSQANAADFANNVLSKYLKIIKVCALANSEECGFPSEIQPSDPTPTSKRSTRYLRSWNDISDRNSTDKGVPIYDTDLSTIISTNDGFSALIHYNPKCGRTNHEVTAVAKCTRKECWYHNIDAACMNVVYDMNGLRGPNHIGEDMGIVTVFWSGLKSMAVAPGIVPYSVNSTSTTATFGNAPGACAQKGTDKIPYYMPSIDELSSLCMNRTLTSLPRDYYWSGSVAAERANMAWLMYDCQYRFEEIQNNSLRVWCVRH